jgi:lysozyme
VSRFVNAKGAMTGAGMLIVASVGAFEGLQLKSYRDIAGIWTACYGETRNIREGMTFTKPDCDAMLLASLVKHERGMRGCLSFPDAIPVKAYIAFASLTYNIGVEAFCRSTLAAKANEFDIAGACREILKWDRARIAGVMVQVRRAPALPGGRMIRTLFAALSWKWKLAALAILAAGVIGAGVAIYSNIYNSGYDDAIADVAARNAQAAKDVKAAVGQSRACRDAGGRWDQSRGVCRQD